MPDIGHLPVGVRFRSIARGEVESEYADAVNRVSLQALGYGLPAHKLVHAVVHEALGEMAESTVLIDGFPKESEMLDLVKGDIRNGTVSYMGVVVVQVTPDTSLHRQVNRAREPALDHSSYGHDVATKRTNEFFEVTMPVIHALGCMMPVLNVCGEGPLIEVQTSFTEAVGLLL